MIYLFFSNNPSSGGYKFVEFVLLKHVFRKSAIVKSQSGKGNLNIYFYCRIMAILAGSPWFLFFFRVPTRSGNDEKPGKSRQKFHAWKNHGICKKKKPEKSWNFVK